MQQKVPHDRPTHDRQIDRRFIAAAAAAVVCSSEQQQQNKQTTARDQPPFSPAGEPQRTFATRTPNKQVAYPATSLLIGPAPF